MKKAFAVVITLILSLTALTGCKVKFSRPGVKPLSSCEVKIVLAAEGTPEDYSTVVNEINYRLMEDGRPYRIKFDFVSFNNYGTTLESKAKEKYDLGWIHVDTMTDYHSKDLLLDIDDYYAEYGKVLKERTPAYALEQAKINGKLYAVPRHAPVANGDSTLLLRGDWLREAGLISDTKAEITTIDEYNQYLAYVHNNKTTGEGAFAYANDNANIHLLREIAPTFYFPVKGSWGQRPLYVDLANPENGKYVVKNFYETQEFRDWADQAAEYIDAGWAAVSLANPMSSYTNSLTGTVASHSIVYQNEQVTRFKAINGSGEMYTLFFEPEDEAGNSVNKYVVTGSDNMMAVLKFSANPNEAIDFLNWMRSSQENHDLVCYGIEGEHYYKVGEDTADKLAKISFKDPKSSTYIPTNKRYMNYMPSFSFNDIGYMRFSEHCGDTYIERVRNWEKNDAQGKPVNYTISPLVGFNLDTTNNTLLTLKASVLNKDGKVDQMVTGRLKRSDIVASTGKTEYAQLLQDVQDGRISELIAEVQRQIDAFMAGK